MSIKHTSKQSQWMRPGRFWRSMLRYGVAGCLSWFATSLAQAQTPAAPDAPGVLRTFLRNSNIKLPIEISPQARPNLESISLYVKEGGAQGAWVRRERVSPDQSFFVYRAPADGEYWFNIVSTDKQNRANPANIETAPPALIVIVDTQPPQVDVKALQSQPEGLFVQIDVRDPNLEPNKTAFFFQTMNQAWHPLEPTTNRRDTYCIPTQAAITGAVKVVAFDQANNQITREFQLGGTQAVAKTPPAPPTPTTTLAPAVNAPSAAVAATAPKQSPLVHDSGIPTLPNTNKQDERIVYLGPDGKELTPAQAEALFNSGQPRNSLVQTSGTGVAPLPLPLPSHVAQRPSTLPPTPPFPVAVHQTAQPEQPTPNIQLVNDTRLFLDYSVESQGNGGVGKVDIWATRDRGHSWFFLCTDAKKQSPAEIRLPDEGLFGIKLVVANLRGYGAEPPRQGDQADWWIEVDKSAPKIKLTDLQSGSREDNYAVHIRWTAEDRNLADEPIELYYAASREGPWHPIAKGLRNDGHYRWNAPGEAGREAFIRVVARDKAGNAALSEITKPWPLDDGTRPQAIIRAVSTTPPTGSATQPFSHNSATGKLDVTSMPMLNQAASTPPSIGASPTMPAAPVMTPTPLPTSFQPVEYRINK
jgi:hypothetical protein